MGKGKPRHDVAKPLEKPKEKAHRMWDIAITEDEDGPQRVEITTDGGYITVYSNGYVEGP
jgi:hypothetical protein